METKAAKIASICSLTPDWQSRTIEAPRSRGGIIRYRFIVVSSKHEWTLSEERENGIPLAVVHAARFADMAPTFKSLAKLDPVVCLKRVAEGLEKITGKPLTFPPSSKKGCELWIEMGNLIDTFYGVNYAKDNGIKAKLFGSDDEEDDE